MTEWMLYISEKRRNYSINGAETISYFYGQNVSVNLIPYTKIDLKSNI